MARKTRRALPGPAPTAFPLGHWGGYLTVGLFCLALGIGGTYLALRPTLAQAAQTRTLSAQSARDQGNAAEDASRWPEAITLYTQAIAGGIDNADIRTDLGVAYFKSSQPQKALAQYALARTLDPHHENSLFNQAAAYANLGDSNRAIALWNEYIKEFPQGQHVSDARMLITQIKNHPPTLAGPAKAM